jgi:C-terminal processing protease CtpA/Prc
MTRRTISAIVSLLRAGLLLLVAAPVSGQAGAADTTLRFDSRGWGGGPAGTIFFDSSVVHGGRVAARLERDANSPEEFTSITRRLPIEFGGRSIELRAFLRTEDVKGSAGLWMREDGPSGPVQFVNMQDRPVTGTSEWAEYAIRLPLDTAANDLYFGVLLSGSGKVWADGLQLLVDGKSLGEALQRPRVTTVLDRDQEFAAGSRIDLTALSPTQADHLTVLGMVWGFLKYRHPGVAGGKVQWDFELFRVLPSVLAAPDKGTLARILAEWVEKLGVPAGCNPCAESPQDAALRPNIGWIQDTTLLGATLSRALQTIDKLRVAGDSQFYVTQVPGVGNPVFDRELAYANMHPPDAGFRILALFRFWNIIEYWFPYRDIIGEDWRAVLRDELPRLVAASTWDAYRLEMMALIARAHDTHANLWSSLDVRPPRGTCAWPVSMRFVEGRPTVTAFSDTVAGPGSGLEIGDVIVAIAGQRVDSLVEAWLPYYAASNRVIKLRDIGASLPKGDCGAGSVTVARHGQTLTRDVVRTPVHGQRLTHDRPGETFQLLSPDVAYLKLSTIRVADVADYVERASGTRGLIIDIRNYPNEFVVFALGGHLVSEPTPFARFTVGELQDPGAFTWTEPVMLRPLVPRYTGNVVILVDEVSISQAEYTAMAFRAAPGAMVVGSTTAGADGNVSPIPLPGGLRTLISGIGVFYPDKKPTQRVGIVPDVVVTPTIDGIMEGRDEVLEAAVRQILGPHADPGLIRKMTAARGEGTRP